MNFTVNKLSALNLAIWNVGNCFCRKETMVISVVFYIQYTIKDHKLNILFLSNVSCLFLCLHFHLAISGWVSEYNCLYKYPF